MAARSDVLLTELHRCELAHSLQQQVFRAQASPTDTKVAFLDFEHDCRAGLWRLADLPPSTFDTCISLAHRFTAKLGCRTLDALHVAAALELGAEEFWTFDERQKQLAAAVGLRAE